MTLAFRAAAVWIDQALACLSEAIERMPDDRFLAEHQAAHDATRSPSGDLVAATLEREYWRRFPEGREDDPS
ncbi:hypothetical protein FJ970_17980 [Mesorhizobium sp. B2-1-8]|uniref:hypothetical protein n=1 Tax=Mesorhizobium sp. B2-1-8 TaxID=2589967 RepID=UPI0011286BFE|nr:hypothetical protein [Mesorhizobium sp. B2-1-8]UCI17022.1 hypothetical protein FJ970_17980 [Mesorhizobium sp. B2-1-8]